jgi:PAS domain S-box-containing protein
MSDGSGSQPPKNAELLVDGDACLRSLIEAADDYAVVTLDAGGCVAGWNAGAERLLGWRAAAIAGKPAAVFLPTTPIQSLDRAPSQCIRLNGSTFNAEVTMTVWPDEAGAARAHTVVIHDISGRTRAAESREQTQFWLTSVLESAMDAIITIDVRQRIVLFNRAAEEMFRYSAAEVRGEPLERLIPHRLREVHAHHIADFGATGVTSRTMGHLGTLTGLKSNGGEFPIEASISQAEVDGSKLFTVIIRDITQRKRSEERQSLLLLELAHRVKNTLAIVQSIVAQTSRFAAAETLSDALTGRLAALGSAHDLLNATEWAGATLADVVRSAFIPYEGFGTAQRWAADGPAIWLASNEAVTLSLVFHELAANAIKYGALSSEAGTVTVEWILDPEIDPVALAIHWREKGGPNVTPPARQGFGSRLIKEAITHEFGGGAKLEFPSSGAECHLYLPLSQKVTIQP